MADLSELLRSISVSLAIDVGSDDGEDNNSHAYTIMVYSYALDNVEIDAHARGKSKYHTLIR